ncbi:MAG: TCR/Tet family MFS transporter [Blastochloris sp.]|nr:TCR/Tet family MFS transporter [Blastochloris sp.]
MGFAGAAFGLGLMLGPASGGLLAGIDLSLPPFLAAGLACANGLFGLALLAESLPPERRMHQPGNADRMINRLVAAIGEPSTRPLLLAIFLLNLAFNGLQSNFTIFSLERFGWTPLQNGLLFAFVGFCAVIAQGVLIGRLQPRFGEPWLVVGGLGLMAIGLPLLALAPSAWMLYPLTGLMAIGSGLAIPSITSLVSRQAGAERQGMVMGGVQSVLSLTLVIGPFVAGLLFDLVGTGAPYLAGGVFVCCALMAAISALYRELRRSTVGSS